MTLARLSNIVVVAAWSVAVGTFQPGIAFAQRAAPAPPPTDLAVTTKDGVQIKITYYPSTDGRQAVPVVLLHDFNETRAVFKPLALALQKPAISEDGPPVANVRPRAVVAVDLRGHGESKTAFNADGSVVKLDANRFEAADFRNMVDFDLEAVRSFLVEQNDAGRLNLNKLCVVGSGMGANVAVLWAAKDWAMPNLAARKQGQDIKALVLVSPRWNYRGLSLVAPLKFPPIQRQLSIFLAYGADDHDVAEENENIQEIFERYHPEPPADQVQQLKDYFVYAPETNLQGTELLTKRQFGMIPKVQGFIEARLGRMEMPYVQRKR